MTKDIQKISINDLEFDAQTGELISKDDDMLKCDPAFSGVKNGRVYVLNKPTAINVKKFQSLPKSVRDRILLYPNSDYTRDILSQPLGTVVEDTFPNFKDISYTQKGEAIILKDDEGQPIRAKFFMD